MGVIGAGDFAGETHSGGFWFVCLLLVLGLVMALWDFMVMLYSLFEDIFRCGDYLLVRWGQNILAGYGLAQLRG